VSSELNGVAKINEIDLRLKKISKLQDKSAFTARTARFTSSLKSPGGAKSITTIMMV
jgi:hypothetical protein